ncbi:MAG: hypothetical protein H7Z20_03040 [Bdellovibrio sp.]|nr:hypothetical protein [Methylotenera sp.]
MASLGNNYSNDVLHKDAANVDLAHEYSANSNNLHHCHHSAVSWGAVLAGTTAAAALSLILIILGFGLGMSSISVWSGQGISTETLGITTILWLAFTQIIAYGMGGYLAGRLRTKWVSVHSDEVYFRDTAHGFLTWALASLLCATLLTSVIGSIVGGSAKAGATIIGGTSSALITGASANMDVVSKSMPSSDNLTNYMIGTLFRKEPTSESATAIEPSAETNVNGATSQQTNQVPDVMSIFMNSMGDATLPQSDVKYVGRVVSQNTGLSQQDAEKRVEQTFASLQEKKASAITLAKTTAEKARKVAANTSLWFFVMLLVGAFSASLAATWGGKSRDY